MGWKSGWKVLEKEMVSAGKCWQKWCFTCFFLLFMVCGWSFLNSFSLHAFVLMPHSSQITNPQQKPTRCVFSPSFTGVFPQFYRCFPHFSPFRFPPFAPGASARASPGSPGSSASRRSALPWPRKLGTLEVAMRFGAHFFSKVVFCQSFLFLNVFFFVQTFFFVFKGFCNVF